MKEQMDKEYLGNSIYAETQHSVTRITTENGLPDDPSNKIYIDEEAVARKLIDYLTRTLEN